VKIVALLTATIVIFSCNNSKKNIRKNSELQQFTQQMIGTYSSKAQSVADTNYFSINLVMHPIWQGQSSKESWLYVEQAVSATLDKPYRQRVYKLQYQGNNIYTSDIYTIKNQQKFIGLQSNKDKQALLTPADIELKEGCTVTLLRNGNNYNGGTDADKCPSDLRGAKYATTKITMEEGKLISWDQGFDGTGKQVWGATLGGYIFLKQ
jgi:hypothetical protein